MRDRAFPGYWIVLSYIFTITVFFSGAGSVMAQEATTNRWPVTLTLKVPKPIAPRELRVVFQHTRSGLTFEVRPDEAGIAIAELPEGPYQVQVQRDSEVLLLERLWVRPQSNQQVTWEIHEPPSPSVTPSEQPDLIQKAPRPTPQPIQSLAPAQPLKGKEEAVNPLHDSQLWEKALSAAREGKYEESIPLWESFLKLYPDDLNGLYNLGLALLKANRCTEAIPYLSRLDTSEVQTREALMALAECTQRVGQWDKACAYYERLLEEEPSQMVFWYNLAVCSFYQGDSGKEQKGWKKVLELAPDSPHAKLARQMLQRFSTLPR